MKKKMIINSKIFKALNLKTLRTFFINKTTKPFAFVQYMALTTQLKQGNVLKKQRCFYVFNIHNKEVDNVTLISNIWFLRTISLTLSYKSNKIMGFIKKPGKRLFF